MKKRFLLLLMLFPLGLFAQLPYTYQTFKSTTIVNTQSVETLQKRRLDILIGHRFGDMFGDAGGWNTFYGLEAASDVMIGADYGVTNNFTIGIARTKGSGPHRMLMNLHGKYKFLHQREGGGLPFTATAYGLASFSTMQASPNESDLNHFAKFAHRLTYTVQVALARKFSDKFSLQLTPGYTHRNIVPFEEANGLFHLGLGTRIGISKHHALILDATIPFYSNVDATANRTIPLGIGWEIDTGGHRFQINLTNSTGIMANDFVPYTTSDWGEGQFRLGFTISRWFNL